jgi:hypothetical protein
MTGFMVAEQKEDGPVTSYLSLEEGKKTVVADVANVAEQGEIGSGLFEFEVVIGWMCLEVEVGEDLERNGTHDLEVMAAAIR